MGKIVRLYLSDAGMAKASCVSRVSLEGRCESKLGYE